MRGERDSPPTRRSAITFAHTRPLALVDKHFRGKDSAYPYPQHLPNVQPVLRQSQHQHHPPPHSDVKAQAHLQCHPQSQLSPRSILRVHERTSDFDSESPPAITGCRTSTSYYHASAANQGIPYLHLLSRPSLPCVSFSPSFLPLCSQIPISHSTGQTQNLPRFRYEQGDCSMSSVLGVGVGIGVELRMDMGADEDVEVMWV